MALINIVTKIADNSVITSKENSERDMNITYVLSNFDFIFLEILNLK